MTNFFTRYHSRPFGLKNAILQQIFCKTQVSIFHICFINLKPEKVVRFLSWKIDIWPKIFAQCPWWLELTNSWNIYNLHMSLFHFCKTYWSKFGSQLQHNFTIASLSLFCLQRFYSLKILRMRYLTECMPVYFEHFVTVTCMTKIQNVSHQRFQLKMATNNRPLDTLLHPAAYFA